MAIKRNVIYNLLGRTLPTAISIYTIPKYLDAIGEARFGQISLIWLIVGYTGLLDLGFGRAVTKKISETRNKKDRSEKLEIISTGLAISLVSGLLGGLFVYAFCDNLIAATLELTPAENAEIEEAVPFIAAVIPIMLVTTILTGALSGKERFLEVNYLAVLAQSLFTIMPLLAAIYIRPELPILMSAILLSRLLVLTATAIHVRAHFGMPNLQMFTQKKRIKMLFGYGGWVTISNIISPIMTSLDRFLIGSIAGSAAVATYAVPYQLVSKVTILASSVAEAIFPRISSEEPKEVEDLPQRAYYFVLLTTGPIVAAALVAMNPFLEWWISEEFSRNAHVAASILLCGFWINGLAIVPYIKLQGKSQPKLIAKIHLIEALPYLAILVWSLKLWGVNGAAIAFTLRTTSDFVLLSIAAKLDYRSIVLALLALAFLVFLAALSIQQG